MKSGVENFDPFIHIKYLCIILFRFRIFEKISVLINRSNHRLVFCMHFSWVCGSTKLFFSRFILGSNTMNNLYLQSLVPAAAFNQYNASQNYSTSPSSYLNNSTSTESTKSPTDTSSSSSSSSNSTSPNPNPSIETSASSTKLNQVVGTLSNTMANETQLKRDKEAILKYVFIMPLVREIY